MCFPYVLNTPENRNLECSWPPLCMYDTSKNYDAEKKKFVEWHAAQQWRIFDLREELFIIISGPPPSPNLPLKLVRSVFYILQYMPIVL